jgi:hypothetical protein
MIYLNSLYLLTHTHIIFTKQRTFATYKWKHSLSLIHLLFFLCCVYHCVLPISTADHATTPTPASSDQKNIDVYGTRSKINVDFTLVC